jgi:hypothetical protein
VIVGYSTINFLAVFYAIYTVSGNCLSGKKGMLYSIVQRILEKGIKTW